MQNNNQHGFSLFEVMLAIALFVTATAVIADVFIQTNRAQRTTKGIVTAASDARFALESLARTARLSMIDYDYYANGIVQDDGESVLALRSGSGTAIKFSQQTGTVCGADVTNTCLAVCFLETCIDDSADWTALTPESVVVPNLRFMIYPTSSPFDFTTAGVRPDAQPRVTIIMTSENDTQDPSQQKSLRLQTTVSSRVYDR